MASNFAFQQMGPGVLVTVAGTTPTTTSLSIGIGITTGGYPASTVRMANLGLVSAFIQFGGTGAGVSANVTSGMAVLQGTAETFSCRGAPFLSCASAGTTTLQITPGEGL